MECASISAVEAVNPLIKLVKQREDLYFELLSFVNKNIQSSSNDLDNLTIFNKFLIEIKIKNDSIKTKEQQFLLSFQDVFNQSSTSSDDPKEILRLSSRLIEILEASITKVRKSVFEDNGRSIKQFTRFKIMLNKILKRQTFIIKDYVEYIINYCTNKYQKQIMKLNKYVQKVQQGENIWFRQLYNKQSSDVEISPEKNRNQEKLQAKTSRKIDMTQHLSSTQQHQKKAISLKKTSKTSTKKRERLLNIRNKQKQQEQESQEPLTKQQTANKLLKFYSLLELNKKQFLEDYVYDKIEQQRHRAQLLNKLLQRNKQINKQINGFVKKSCAYIPTYIPPPSSANKSSGDERNQSVSSKLSLRTSFIISKRKASFHFQSSDSQKKKEERGKEPELFQKTIKNVNPRRRSSHSNRPQDKSKKLFVVKAPMVFEEEIIPQAQMTQTQWFQQPFSTKTKEKRNQNIRLKRKNNPNPLQNAFFPQNFRYPL